MSLGLDELFELFDYLFYLRVVMNLYMMNVDAYMITWWHVDIKNV